MNKENKDFYTIPVLAEMYSISRNTLYKYVRSGKVKSEIIGDNIRIRKEDWDKFRAESREAYFRRH